MPRKRASESGKKVVVFGAGVAGLTAAHELATRGYAVHVISPRIGPGQLGGAAGSRALARGQIHPFGRVRAALPAGGELPGAQETRAFPAHFQHLWELLGTIPLPGRSGRTVRDHLAGGPPRTDSPLLFSVRPTTPAALMETLVRFAGAHAPEDAQTFALRIVRYLLTCPGRRAAELHGITVDQYLHGGGPRSPAGSLGYSPPFEEHLRRFPRLLDGLDPTRADARSVLNLYLQVLLAPLRTEALPGGVLQGPAAQTWFEPWRAHLEGQKVRFLAGRLLRLTPGPRGRPRAVVRGGRGLQRVADQADYLIVATDPATAELASGALPRVGVPAELQGFTGPTAQRWQARTRVMFFFREALDDAAALLPGASADLVVQRLAGAWTRPLSLARDGYASVLVVDRLARRGPFSPRTSAAALARLAGGLWRQLSEARSSAGATVLPEPVWFSVVEGGATPPAILQVPLAGDWIGRPGPEPTEPPSLHGDRLAFAGRYLKTFSRVPSVEADCESGRHAANAILVHDRTGRGAPAHLWDPELQEAPELQALRAMDQWCFERQLPHPFEIAGLDGLIGAFSWSGLLAPLLGPLVRPLMERFLAAFRGGNGAAPSSAASRPESLLLMLRNIRTSFEEQLARNKAPAAVE